MKSQYNKQCIRIIFMKEQEYIWEESVQSLSYPEHRIFLAHRSLLCSLSNANTCSETFCQCIFGLKRLDSLKMRVTKVTRRAMEGKTARFW